MSNKFFQPQVHPKYRPDIDGLRAIAVLTVVAFHAFPDCIFGGFIGVDIFFVISGFLITEIIYRHLVLSNFNLLTFILRRIRRLFPALVIVLFVTFTLAEITLSKLDQVEIGKQVFAGIFFMSNLYFRNLGDYFGPDSKDLALLNLWSLAVEEQFYLVWPPILMLIFSLKRKLLLPALICIGVYSFFVNIAGASVSPTASFFGPISRFWELILGGLSFFLLDYLKRESIQSKWLSIIGIFLITTGYISIDSKNYSGWWALYPTAGTALIIISDRGSLLNRVLSCKPLVCIGLISYPIYLWHWPLLFFTRAYFVNPSTYQILVTVIISFFASALTYFYIEVPIRKLSLRKGFVLSMSGVASLSFFIVFCWSILPDYKKSLIFPYDPLPYYRSGECFLNSFTQGPVNFSKKCIEKVGENSRSVLLWGDSMAAHLYPGLKSLQQKYGFELIQRTSSSCPPSTSNNYKQIGNCNAINESTRQFIEVHRPQKVILAGRFPTEENLLDHDLRELVKFLRGENIREIVILGPMPDWRPNLRSILLNSNFMDNLVPVFMAPPREWHEKVIKQDALLKKVSKKYHITYISPLSLFCDEKGLCRVSVSSKLPDGLITADHDHLTDVASKYMWNEIEMKLTGDNLDFN